MRRILCGTLVLLFAVCVATCFAADPRESRDPRVKVETTMGDFIIRLYPEKAPKTVRNFLVYARSGFYDGTIFHRVVSGFVVQGGGFDEMMRQKATRPAIENEADNGLRNSRYTLSMARTSDPHSATSQFFINLADNSMLDHRDTTASGYGYAVFGKVVKGKKVIDQMGHVLTDRMGMYSDVPVSPIVIKKMTLIP